MSGNRIPVWLKPSLQGFRWKTVLQFVAGKAFFPRCEDKFAVNDN